MWATRVPSLFWEDHPRLGAAKPVHHNSWAQSLESTSLTTDPTATEARVPGAPALQREATATRSLSTATGEKPLRAATRESPPSNEDPELPKSKSQ